MRVPRRVAAYDLVAVPGETVDTAGGKVVRLEILLPLVFTEQGNPQSLPGGAFQPADVGRLSDVRFL